MRAPEARTFRKWFRPLKCGLLLGVLAGVSGALAQSTALCATPGKDGVGNNLSGVVNTYYPGSSSVSAGATSIAVGALTGATAPISAGDLLLVIQMQDAALNTTNSTAYGSGGTTANGATSVGAGKYEYVVAAGAVSGGGVQIKGAGTGGGLMNSYSASAYSTSSGQKTFQVIRVPQYSSVTLGGKLTAPAWNGATGGVVAIDVSGTLSLSGGNIDVSGLGFRGGAGRTLAGASTALNTDYRNLSTLGAHAQKGEGVAGTPRYLNNNGALLDNVAEGYPNGSSAQGAPGNAGGGGTDGNAAANDQNTGGGGGANGGSGGRGGNAWSSGNPTGGYGGAAMTASAGKLVMGGGGGAGTTNNGTGTPGSGFASSGASGGGLVFVRAGAVNGTGTISASGADANNTVINDGSGGGGAGGSVLVVAQGALPSSLTINANGGRGGTNTGGGSPHGPGGGGGGGVVALSGTGPAVSVTGGGNGTTSGTAAFGATSGLTGQTPAVTGSQVPGVQATALCQPLLVSKSFSPTTVVSGGTVTLTLTVTNPNAAVVSALGLTDDVAGTMGLPAPLVLRTTANTCGGTASAPENGNGIYTLTGGSVAASSSCTVTIAFTVSNATAGSKTNTIPAADVTGTVGGTSVTAGTPATASLTVTASSAGSGVTCDANFYQLRQDPTTLLSTLYRLDPAAPGAGGTPLWVSGFGPALNGLGYNAKDSYFYAVNIAPLSSGEPYRLYRLGAGGAAEYAPLSGLPGGGSIAAGTVDRAGVMYIKKQQRDSVIYRYDIASKRLLPALTVANVQLFDLAINPVDNQLYGVVTPGVVYRIDPETGVTATVGTAATATASNAIGSAFFNAAGTLYGYQNGGVFGTINLNTGALSQTGTSVSAAQSDGASCPFGPPPSITLLKLGRNTSAGAFSSASIDAKPGDAVEYCIVYTNTGGPASTFVLTDYVPVGMAAELSGYGTSAGGHALGLKHAAGVALAAGQASSDTVKPGLTSRAGDDEGSLSNTPTTKPGETTPVYPGLMTLTLPSVAGNSSGTVCFQAKVP